MRLAYHWFMANYWRLRLKFYIWKLKRKGKKHGLPSLDGYSDEAIVEGFRRLYESKDRV